MRCGDRDAESAAGTSIRDIARARGFRSRLVVPLKSDSGVIGAISITRDEPGAFADHTSTAADLRRPGGDRDTERSTVQ